MQLKALDKQLPDFYRSELTKESSLSSVLPAASSTVSSSTHAPLQLMHTISPKRFLPHPIPFPARPADLSKPCRCPLCPRSFLHNGGLRVHIERCTCVSLSLTHSLTHSHTRTLSLFHSLFLSSHLLNSLARKSLILIL